jgi:hypothetical protein
MEDVISVAPDELKKNWNRLVTVALEDYARRRRLIEFEESMARMAADPAIQKECAAIQRDFAGTELDGLGDD